MCFARLLSLFYSLGLCVCVFGILPYLLAQSAVALGGTRMRATSTRRGFLSELMRRLSKMSSQHHCWAALSWVALVATSTCWTKTSAFVQGSSRPTLASRVSVGSWTSAAATPAGAAAAAAVTRAGGAAIPRAVGCLAAVLLVAAASVRALGRRTSCGKGCKVVCMAAARPSVFTCLPTLVCIDFSDKPLAGADVFPLISLDTATPLVLTSSRCVREVEKRPVVALSAEPEVLSPPSPACAPEVASTHRPRAARFVGGVRQPRAYFRRSCSARASQAARKAARRTAGARCSAVPAGVSEPTVLSFDASKLRGEIQSGLRVSSGMRSAGSMREGKIASSATSCRATSGVYIEANDSKSLCTNAWR